MNLSHAVLALGLLCFAAIGCGDDDSSPNGGGNSMAGSGGAAEATAADVCELICPGEDPLLGLLERCSNGGGGAGGQGGAGGDAGAVAYDRQACRIACIENAESTVAPGCMDEYLTVTRCITDPDNYVCMADGSATTPACNALFGMFGGCTG